VIINEDIEVSIPVEIAPDQVPEWKSRRLEAGRSRRVGKDRIWQISAGSGGRIQSSGAASRKYAAGCRAEKNGNGEIYLRDETRGGLANVSA